jgi:hypothetical protein
MIILTTFLFIKNSNNSCVNALRIVYEKSWQMQINLI